MKTLTGPSRILGDEEVVTEDHYCGLKDNEINGMRNVAMLVSNERAIGQKAGECRKLFKSFEFYANEPEPVFGGVKFNFIGSLDELGRKREKCTVKKKKNKNSKDQYEDSL